MNRLIIFIFFFIIAGCTPSEMILFDFESNAQLDKIHWKCHVLYSISNEHFTHGKKSLRMELYPSEYPGFVPFLNINNWKRYSSVCFDIYNPEDNDVVVIVRIDDVKDETDYHDRYNQRFIIKSGANNISIPLNTLETSDGLRHLDLSNIYKFLIFMGHPEKKHTLYIDYICLKK